MPWEEGPRARPFLPHSCYFVPLPLASVFEIPPPFLTLNSPFIVLPDAVSGERRDRDQVRPKFGQIFPSAFIRSCLNTHPQKKAHLVPPTYIRLPNSWQTSWRPSQHMYIHACVYTCLHILPVHPFRTGNTIAPLRHSLLLCILHTLA